MFKRLQMILALLLLLPALAFAPLILAHEGEDDEVTTTSEAEKKELTDEQKKRISEKHAAYKEQLAVKLAQQEKLRLAGKCKPAQVIVKSLATRQNARIPQRTKAYENLSTRLHTIIDKLGETEIDTEELDRLHEELDALIETYQINLEVYKTALTELSDIDCEADTDAFKTQLETARAARAQVLSDIRAIKDFVKNDLKEELVNIKQQLESSDDGGEES